MVTILDITKKMIFLQVEFLFTVSVRSLQTVSTLHFFLRYERDPSSKTSEMSHSAGMRAKRALAELLSLKRREGGDNFWLTALLKIFENFTACTTCIEMMSPVK